MNPNRTAAEICKPNPGFDPLLACYDLTRTGNASGIQRLPELEERSVHISTVTPTSTRWRCTCRTRSH